MHSMRHCTVIVWFCKCCVWTRLLPVSGSRKMSRDAGRSGSRAAELSAVSEGCDVTTLAHDLRGALRSLLKSPSHTLVAVLTIGVGIGLNTTMFSIVRAVLLRPLPFPSPDALVRVTADLPASGLQS